MVVIKTKEEIKKMRKVCQKSAQLLDFVEPFVKAGVSTQDLDNIAVDWIKKEGLTSAVLGYQGFPKSICTSVNDVVCHGIPDAKKILAEGDIINVDVTLILDGYHGDTSRTFAIGQIAPDAQKLIERTKKSLMLAIKNVAPNKPINIIGECIEDYTRDFGYGIVTELGGHGIGKKFHEAPFVFHHYQKKRGVTLQEGMTFTIEPMINMGDKEVYLDKDDGWTIWTKDQSLSAQFEHTIAVTQNGAEILTLP